MKKLILFSLSGLLLMVLFNKPKATAQGFHIVASFGTTHAWNVPAAIEYEIYDYYPYHNWVHVNRVVRGRRVFYNILLEQDGFFTELQFGGYARILRVQHFIDYPLYNHYCSAHCGYHNAYFNSHRVVNNHYYYGGHNHFVYRAQPHYLRQPVRPYSVRYAEKNYRHNSGRAVADNSRIISNARESRPTAARSVSSNRSNTYNNDRTVRSNSSSRNYNSNVRNSSTVNRNQGSTVNRSEPVARERTVTRTATNTTRKASSPNTINRGAASNARSSSSSNNNERSVNSRAASSNRSSGTAQRSTSTRSNSSSRASSPAVSNNSRSSSSRSATTTSRTSSSNGRGSGRGN